MGDDTTDRIVASVIDTAKSIWPVQTAEAQAWVNQQLLTYGISYAKYQAQQLGQTISPYFSSPLIWFGLGFAFLYFTRK
jgi:hypothetical protein